MQTTAPDLGMKSMTPVEGEPFPWTNKMPALAQEAAGILARSLDAESVWIFGSVARQDWSRNSDLDLLVVVNQSDQPRHRRARQAHTLLEGIKAPKDVVVLTMEEWNREGRAAASLVSTVRREGVCLYERGK
ncbi:MAG: nucleotidyltransferase domain-containing protein [Opitutaceae bacterium]